MLTALPYQLLNPSLPDPFISRSSRFIPAPIPDRAEVRGAGDEGPARPVPVREIRRDGDIETHVG